MSAARHAAWHLAARAAAFAAGRPSVAIARLVVRHMAPRDAEGRHGMVADDAAPPAAVRDDRRGRPERARVLLTNWPDDPLFGRAVRGERAVTTTPRLAWHLGRRSNALAERPVGTLGGATIRGTAGRPLDVAFAVQPILAITNLRRLAPQGACGRHCAGIDDAAPMAVTVVRASSPTKGLVPSTDQPNHGTTPYDALSHVALGR